MSAEWEGDINLLKVIYALAKKVFYLSNKYLGTGLTEDTKMQITTIIHLNDNGSV